VSAALCAVLAACPADSGVTEDPGSTPPAETGPQALLYVNGITLFSFDLDSGESSRLAELPSADVAVSPDGDYLAVVEETSPAGPSAEGFRKPVVRAATVDDPGTLEKLGQGRSPVWSPDSSEVAAVDEAEGHTKCPLDPATTETEGEEVGLEGCVTAERIVVYPIPSGKPEVTHGADAGWSILGWGGTESIVAIALTSEPFLVVNSPGAGHETRQVLGFAPAEVWGTSPASYTILVVGHENGTFFASPGEGSQPPLEGLGARLGDGAWAPDGETIAAALITGRVTAKSRLVMIDVPGNKYEVMEDTEGVQGNVVWAEDSESFAYVRTSPERKGRLEAVLCEVDDFECEPLFDWREGIKLLGLR
jgi:hypothetical protein